MIMVFAFGYGEDNFYVGIKPVQLMLFVVGEGFKVGTIDAWSQDIGFGQKMFATTVCVGGRFVEGGPLSVCHVSESDWNTGGWSAECRVENVRGDAHGYSDSSQR